MIGIIDYGMGNPGSIRNMFKRIGADSIITGNKDVLAKTDKLIMPGVGSFDAGIERLNNLGLVDFLNERVMREKVPILGICLGMQLFTKTSEEGEKPGLGWLDARTVRFSFDESGESLKIPHMGWNYVNVVKNGNVLNDMGQGSRFYFVHSYHVRCNDPTDVLLTTKYGCEFVSAFCRENILGVQFHPEKSHKFGMKFLKSFVEAF